MNNAIRKSMIADEKAAKSPTFPVPNTNLGSSECFLAYEYDSAVIRKANAWVDMWIPSAIKASDPKRIPQPISRIIDALHRAMTHHVFISLAV